MSLLTRGLLVLVVGTIMGLGLSIGGGMLAERTPALPDDLTWEQARLFAEVMERVKHEYIEPIDDRELVESAIRGMVADLDRHSQYLDSDEYEDIRISTTGNYSGVGVEVNIVDEAIMVIAPIDNTPAHRAGILAGDRIVAIDNVAVTAGNLQQTISSMRGKAGSEVIITIARDAAPEDIVYVLERELIQVASVRHELLSPELGYARISQFTDTTAEELESAVDDMMDRSFEQEGSPLGGLILDLRNNPGGILNAAVDVSDLFIDDGVIVSADGRTPEARFSRTATSGDILGGTAIVVLVNKGSASASEIVAGALQDHRRGTIIGTATFGKGLVQTVMPLSKGRAIKLTTSRYYTPSGDSIHDVGIEPDIAIDNTMDALPARNGPLVNRESDAQLAEAIRYLNSQRVMHTDAT